MRLLICAGGTGGGVYPALAVIQTLGKDADPVLWVGGEGGMEAEMINRMNIPFTAIPAAGIHGVGLGKLPLNILRLIRGVIASRRILATFKPDVILFTGGFVAVPMAVAGTKFPSLLYVPDIEPGLAIKAIARFSDRIAFTAAETKRFFIKRENIAVTGYPTRPELETWTREKAREILSLNKNKPVLLVFGGSKGARSINQALHTNLTEILNFAQVVHITGEQNFDEANNIASTLSSNREDYHPYPFLHEEMGAALSAADLALCRAGASTLGELPLFGLPAILVPYPYAWKYQNTNAEYIVNNGGGVILKDEQLAAGLLSIISELIQNPELLSKMRLAIHSIAVPQAAQRLAQIVRDLSIENEGSRK